jgi:hypothetical protein
VEIESLPTGKSTYQWSVKVENTKTFTFTLQVPQDDGSNRTVNSGPIEITVAETPDETSNADAVATPTNTPIIGEEEVSGLKKVAGNLGLIVAGILVLAIIIAIMISRSRRK